MAGRLFTLFFAAGASFYLLVGYNRSPTWYEEGLMLYGAREILNGGVIYEDFWTLWGPGQYYFVAMMFKALGVSIMAERAATLLTMLSLGLVIFLVAREVMSRGPAFAATGLSIIWLGPLHIFGSPVPAALLLALLSYLAIVRHISGKSCMWLFVAGGLAGMTALFRQDVGILVACSEAAVIGLRARLTTDTNGEDRQHKLIAPWIVPVALYLLGVLVILVPAGILLVSFVSLSTLTDNLFLFPLKVYRSVRSVSYPSLLPPIQGIISGSLSWGGGINELSKALLFVFPPLMIAYGGLELLLRWRRGVSELTVPASWKLLLLLAISMALFGMAIVRSDLGHIWPSIVAGTVLLCVLGERVRASSRLGRWFWPVALIICFVLYSRPLAASANLFMNCWLKPAPPVFTLDVASGIYNKEGAPYEDAVRYVIEHVPPDERIFVGRSPFDQADGGDMLFYFLAGRQSATKYHVMHCGLTNTAPIQQQIVSDLDSHRVKCIVLEDSQDTGGWTCKASERVKILDDYIKLEFEPVERFGRYAIWRRRG
ncbi:MAG: hypothetical protein ACOYXY_22105 [Thermodesulfobacteriota bacterium]